MNLAPLPFLPHTHRKETRFPSNRAGYISVFLGIGVAHDIGDVDTGFILKFSECIRKVCKATKESFFSFQTIKYSSSTSLFFLCFLLHFFNTSRDVSICQEQNIYRTSATSALDRDWFSHSTRAAFTKVTAHSRRAERRFAPSGYIHLS